MSLFLTNIFSFIKLQNKQVSLRTVGKSVFSPSKESIFFSLQFISSNLNLRFIIYMLTDEPRRKCKETTNIISGLSSSVGIATDNDLDGLGI